MILEVRDLGYVKSASIDLSKNLIVLCGPNNSGKTYVAYSIYGLMKFRSSLPKDNTTRQSINLLLKEGRTEIDLVSDTFVSNIEKYLKIYAQGYAKELKRVFASDDNTFAKSKIDIILNDPEEIKLLVLAKIINQQIKIGNTLTLSLNKEKGSSKLICIAIEGKDQIDPQAIPNEFLIDFVIERVLDIFISSIFPQTFIAPAERIAINIFSKELSLRRNILVDKLLELKDENKPEDPFDLITRRATRYPQPIRDSLEIAEDLNNFKRNSSEYSSFADEIERDILKGQVIISKEGEVQFRPDKAKALKLPIHLTASVVKSLSNLVIYFRHIAKSNDFIIIDEPELNLHPDNQIIIARLIAKIANKGFKVLISTHSDYIIREINNLIMLSKHGVNSERFYEKYGYSKSHILDPKKVSAYLFLYEKKKTIDLPIDENGFEIDTIDEVINQLNNRSQELFFNTPDAI